MALFSEIRLLNQSKCILFQRQVKFLGHIVPSEGIQFNPEKISAVRDWLTPKNAKQIRSLLGLCSYYRRFVKNFAGKARPLHALYEKKAKFLSTPERETAFDSLKNGLICSPILGFAVHPRY